MSLYASVRSVVFASFSVAMAMCVANVQAQQSVQQNLQRLNLPVGVSPFAQANHTFLGSPFDDGHSPIGDDGHSAIGDKGHSAIGIAQVAAQGSVDKVANDSAVDIPTVPVAIQEIEVDQLALKDKTQPRENSDSTTDETSEVGESKADSNEGEGESDEESEDSELIKRISALEDAFEDADTAVAKKASDAKKKPSFGVNGRIHLDYWNFAEDSDGIGFFEHQDAGEANFGDDPEDRLFFRRIRLKFEGDLFETMTYRMQIDFNTPESGEMKDMYIGFKNLPLLGTVLFGNQKRPMGMDHLNSSRFNIFIERPLVVEAFNEDARRLGVTSYNHTEDESKTWAIGIYALENLTRDGEIVGDSMQMSGNARYAASPWYDEVSGGRGWFHWAVSGMLARPDGDNFPGDTNNNEGRFRTRGELRSDSRWIDTGRIAGAEWYEIVGLEAALNVGAFHAVGEFQSSWLQRDDTTPGTGDDVNFHGGYFQVAYMLTGEHMQYKRRTGTIDRVKPFENFFCVNKCDGSRGNGMGAWQVAMRYSYLDLTDNDILGGVEKNLSAGLVWYLNPYSSCQFNAIWGDIEDRQAIGGFSEGDFTAIGTQFRVDF